MSHELRTPLSVIIGYAEMLSEEAADQGQEHVVPDLQAIQQTGKHLLFLINELLDLPKIEAGKMELHVEAFLIGPLVDDLVATMQPLVAKNRNRLTVDIPSKAAATEMHSDLVKLR